MITKVFSVFDSKLATFGRPWFQMTDAAALREFADAVNDGSNPNNQWHSHPEDFSLYLVGQFDDQQGELIPCAPSSLVTASSLIKDIVPLGRNGKQMEFDLSVNGESKEASPK